MKLLKWKNGVFKLKNNLSEILTFCYCVLQIEISFFVILVDFFDMMLNQSFCAFNLRYSLKLFLPVPLFDFVINLIKKTRFSEAKLIKSVDIRTELLLRLKDTTFQ